MQLKYLCFGLILLGSRTLGAFAQSPFTGELDMDLRGYATPQGGFSSQLYAVTLQGNADLGNGASAYVDGSRSYSRALIQSANVAKDTGAAGIVSAGIIRVPFGIYDTRETYESGLIDYPIARGDYETDSVDWGVPGVAWTGGTPVVQVQAAAFDGIASGDYGNQDYVGGGAERLQLYNGSLILGVSRWDGILSPDTTYTDRQVVQMTGVDWRYTLPQLLIRGEYMAGILGEDSMHGAYTDIYYHVPKYAPLTIVGRIEIVSPEAGVPPNRQITTGFRYIIAPGWNFAANWIKNNGPPYWYTWSRAATGGGRYEFQIYHVIEF